LAHLSPRELDALHDYAYPAEGDLRLFAARVSAWLRIHAKVCGSLS
jgi:hypothetical protein